MALSRAWIAAPWLCGCAAGQVAMFTPLGLFATGGPNGNASTSADGVSDDGAVVIGNSELWDMYHQIDFPEGVIWREDSGWQPYVRGTLSAVSGDGGAFAGSAFTTLVTQAAFVSPSIPGVAVPPWPPSVFVGLSRDGGAVVGQVNTSVRGTAARGLETLGHLPGSSSTGGYAADVSADGTIVVGGDSNAMNEGEAYVWSPTDGMRGLGFLGNLPVGMRSSYAVAVSADGRMIVGSSLIGVGLRQAFIWKAPGGMHPLPMLTGHTQNFASDVSGDGSVVVGRSSDPAGVSVGYYWDRVRGRRDLKQFLISLGATGLEGWSLTGANAVSPDGAFIVGNGVDPRGYQMGWRAHIPAFCYANCDGSIVAPVLNVADFTCFLARFAAGDPYANCDGSSVAPVLNIADFVCFSQRFAAGCA